LGMDGGRDCACTERATGDGAGVQAQEPHLHCGLGGAVSAGGSWFAGEPVRHVVTGVPQDGLNQVMGRPPQHRRHIQHAIKHDDPAVLRSRVTSAMRRGWHATGWISLRVMQRAHAQTPTPQHTSTPGDLALQANDGAARTHILDVMPRHVGTRVVARHFRPRERFRRATQLTVSWQACTKTLAFDSSCARR